MLRGYDIDGTLTTGLKPIEPFIIISGRTVQEYDDAAKRLASIAPLYIRGVGKIGDQQHGGRFKAEIIKILGVDEFYEDDPIQIEIISALCPACRIVRVLPNGKICIRHINCSFYSLFPFFKFFLKQISPIFKIPTDLPFDSDEKEKNCL